jgi:hypothetical protein
MSKAFKHYTDEQVEYLREIAYKRTRQEITDLFNEKFGTDKTVRSIGCQLSRKKIKTGMQGHGTQFEKNQAPWNKGMKGLVTPGSEKGWFKKGHTDKRAPIGTERVTTDGWTEVKACQPEGWIKKHREVWKEAYGEIPDGYVILFKDGNRQNCDLANLIKVSRATMLSVAKREVLTEYPELNELIYTITELEIAANKRGREIDG